MSYITKAIQDEIIAQAASAAVAKNKSARKLSRRDRVRAVDLVISRCNMRLADEADGQLTEKELRRIIRPALACRTVKDAIGYIERNTEPPAKPSRPEGRQRPRPGVIDEIGQFGQVARGVRVTTDF